MMLTAYLRKSWKPLLFSLLTVVIFTATALLYNLPAEPVLYSLALVLFSGFAFFTADFIFFVRRCRTLEQFINEEKALFSSLLPEPSNRLEADYHQLITTIRESRAALRAENENRQADQLDYYTLWVHQIKTPISAMHLLLQNPERLSPEELDGELFKIEQYVEMVLSYLRLESESSDFSFQEQPLDPIIRDCVKKFARLFILRHITLSYEETGSRAVTDAKWLSLLLEQLLSNALKYTGENGRIAITCENGVLSVRDTGIGIRAEDLPRVFEKGYTGYNGRQERSSTGLGLYLCSKISKKLAAPLSITSKPGAGTCVSIDLSRPRTQYE